MPTTAEHKRGPRSFGRCHDIADDQIRHFTEARDKALRGEGKAHPEVCRDKIDQWLEYRFSHGPDDEAVL